MADNLEKGILFIIAATFFLFSGLELLSFQVFEPGFSIIIAFIALGVGMYFITKK
jgi:hypothetical protein